MLSYLPNILTLSRILAAPFLVIFLLGGREILFVIGVSLVGITDYADGYLARKLHSVSKMGRVLDSAADKILMISVLVTMLMAGYLNIYSLLLLLLRDLVVIIGAAVLFLFNFDTALISSVEHSLSSKITTFLQFITLVSFVFGVGAFYFLSATAIAGAWASVGYIGVGFNLLRARKQTPC